MTTELNVLLTQRGLMDKLRSGVLDFKNTRSKTKQSGLRALQNNIKKLYEVCFDNSGALVNLKEDARFSGYPALSATISGIMALNPAESDDALNTEVTGLLNALRALDQDWVTEQTNEQFLELDEAFGYFKKSEHVETLKGIYNALVKTCRVELHVLEGKQTLTDDAVYRCAYTMMALFIDKKPTLDHVYGKVNNLIKARNKKTEPLSDLFLNINLPKAVGLEDKKGWVQFIINEGERALPFFNQAIDIQKKLEELRAPREKSPITIQPVIEAAACIKYARGYQDPDFAALCYLNESKKNGSDSRSQEAVFNQCLDYMKSGWPKKYTDNLPVLTIPLDNYYWVKLPPNDKRGLILGEITDCCQSIGGLSDACVRDAVSLADNGLYVILKKTKGQSPDPINPDGSLNYDNFQIIGQSYAWKSTSGALCLDSLECLSNSIPDIKLQQLVSKVAMEAFEKDPSITTVHVGRGGKTPQGLFPATRHALTMKQGKMYGDAREQYVIAEAPALFFSKNETLMASWTTYQNDTVEPKSLLTFLQSLPAEDLQAALIATDDNDRTFLSAAVCGIIACSVEDILSLYSNNQARLAALVRKDYFGKNPLHLAANTPESLKMILESLPEAARLQAVSEKDRDGRTVLHLAAVKPELLKMVLELLPEDARLRAVSEKDRDGKTVLHLAAKYPESIKMILESLPEAARLQAVSEKDLYGETVLHRAAAKPESLKMILESLPEAALLQAVSEKDLYGGTALHRAVDNLESLKMILALYPEADARLQAVSEKDLYGGTALHRAVDNLESLKMILALYPEADARLQAVSEKDLSGETVLHRAAAKPESLKMILESLPEAALLQAVSEKARDGWTVLHLAANTPESLKMILELYPEAARLTAVSEKYRDGDTVVHLAANNPESLKMILDLLPEDAQLKAIREKDSYGRTVLDCAADNPESLKIIEIIQCEHNKLQSKIFKEKMQDDLKPPPQLDEASGADNSP